PVMLAESRSPMHSDLVVDLRVVREKGLGHLHYATPALTVACASARLQTETKLYDAPRSDSYGFTLASGGQFYERQRLAYYRILRDAKPFPEDAERPVLPVEP
ncbi:MAG: hypothetical protein ACRDTE_11575, partial [Pseudonocardiaceae bacterium]